MARAGKAGENMVQSIRAGRAARACVARKATGTTQQQIFTEVQAAERMRAEIGELYSTLGWPEEKRAADYNEIVDAMIDRAKTMLRCLETVRGLGN